MPNLEDLPFHSSTQQKPSVENTVKVKPRPRKIINISSNIDEQSNLVTRTENEWVKYFGTKQKKLANEMLQFGSDLLIAKSQLSHGRWLPFLESIGMTERTAQRFLSIGRLASRSNTTDGGFDLPNRMGVLDELGHWSEEQFTSAIESGVITSETTETDLKRWLKQYKEALQSLVDKSNQVSGVGAPEQVIKALRAVTRVLEKFEGSKDVTTVDRYNKAMVLLNQLAELFSQSS